MSDTPHIEWSVKQDPESWVDKDVEVISRGFYDAIRMEERAAIVAWLRAGGCWKTIAYDVEEAYYDAADGIEAGEHLK